MMVLVIIVGMMVVMMMIMMTMTKLMMMMIPGRYVSDCMPYHQRCSARNLSSELKAEFAICKFVGQYPPESRSQSDS